MSHVLRVDVADQIALFRAYNTDNSGKTDLTSATAGLTLSVFRTGLAPVSIASLTDKAADNTAHADGAIRHVSGNLYTVDLPDAATATQCSSVGVRGSYTGGVIEPVPHPIVNYNPATAAIGANTTTPLDAAGTRTALGLGSANLDTQLADIPTVSEFEARTLPSADYFVVSDYTAPANADIAAILVDTNELQTDWANGGRLDLILDARASQTSVDTIDGIVDAILVDTAALPTFPANFAALGINVSGHISRVVLVDTTTTNTDLAAVATEVGKIPRGASAIAAGGNATKTKVSANGTTLVEAIT